MVKLRRAVPAGVLDSGLASLATFVIGFYTVRVLDPVSLGVYALFFSAFSTIMVVATQLLFTPAEVTATRLPTPRRIRILWQGLRIGVLPSVMAALSVAGVAFAVPGHIDRAVVVPLLVTAVTATALSPIQDHARRMLHISERSWSAAAVSAMQLLGVVGALAGLALLGVPSLWQPFGALSIANAASLALGAVLAARVPSEQAGTRLRLSNLVRPGKWLLVVGLAPNAAGFLAATLVAHLASAEALGFAEGARILARPVSVLALGITSVLGPRLMSSAAARDAAQSKRYGRVFYVIVGLCGVLYLFVAGFDWDLNVLPRVLPNAYAVPGLAAASILAYIVNTMAGGPLRPQMIGAGRERPLAFIETLSSGLRALGGATAPVTGAFAIPIGYLGMALTRQVGMRLAVRRLYATPRNQVAE